MNCKKFLQLSIKLKEGDESEEVEFRTSISRAFQYLYLFIKRKYRNDKRVTFKDDNFDSIVMFEVFEHVFNPDEFLREVYRVLKSEGVLLMTVSFVWDEHEQPYDFARYTSFGIRDFLKRHGFQIIEQRKSLADIRVISQLLNAYFYKVLSLSKRNRIFYIASMLFITAPINILGSIKNPFNFFSIIG